MPCPPFRFRSAAASLALISLCVGAGAAQPRYRITDLGDLSGGAVFSAAYAINNAGEIVGESATDTGLKAFRWASGAGMQALGSLDGGLETGAYAVNKKGLAAGRSDVHAVRWTQGDKVRDLGTLGEATFDVGLGINRNGHVVGYSSTIQGLRAFYWTNSGGMCDLGDLPGGNGRSVAYGVNDNNTVVGSSDVQSPRRATDHAFRWTAATGMVDLGTLRGASADYYSEARAVNNVEHVVGLSDVATGKHAFIWKPDTGMLDLGELPQGTGYSDAKGINDRSHVVGVSDSVHGLTAFFWSAATGMLDLNDLIDPADPLKPSTSISTAYAINNRGQIVGSAFFNGTTRAFLLTPVIEASAPGTR